MINRIKQWDLKNFNVSDRSIMSLTFVVALMALIIAIPGGTNCASADTCSVSSTANFTGDVALKSNTNYSATLQHSLAANVIANFEDPGYAHTGSLILRDSSGDLNLVDGSGNGGLGLGNSATSTNGFLRWTGSEVQVYNSGWTSVGGTPTNDIGQVTADSGSFTAATQQDNINIVGGTNITTAITSDTLTINASSPAASTEFARFHIGSDQALTYAGSSTSIIDFDVEDIDTENCFSENGSGTITYDASCNSAYYQLNTRNIISFSGLTSNGAMIQGQFTGGISPATVKFRTWVTLFNIPNYTLTINEIICIDPSDTMRVDFYHGSGYSTGTATWLGGDDESSLTLIKLKEKGSGC